MEKDNLTAKLKTLFQNQNLSAVLLQSRDQKTLVEIVDETIRFLVCSNSSWVDDGCNFCQRAVKHRLIDVLYLGDGVNEIGKDSVKAMMNQLSLSALEMHGKKIYVIQNAENLKIGAANALLKFLEEPPTQTVAFLLTNDWTKVLPTIKSRCQFFALNQMVNKNEKNALELVLESKNKETYLLASAQFKKKDKTEFLQELEDACQRTILHQFPDFLEDTLILINDLKTLPNEKLAIDHYFIKIAERI